MSKRDGLPFWNEIMTNKFRRTHGIGGNSINMRDELNALLNALISGGRYGVKIRLPHAFVMTFLFRQDLSIQDKLKVIAKATSSHASNLALFAFVYKFVLFLQKFRRKQLGSTPAGEPQHAIDAIIGGALGGYFIWGRYSAVNYQINLYLFSRVIIGGILYAKQRGLLSFIENTRNDDNKGSAYPIFSSAVWGLVMYLFEKDAPLHPSLKRSMEEIYKVDNKVTRSLI